MSVESHTHGDLLQKYNYHAYAFGADCHRFRHRRRQVYKFSIPSQAAPYDHTNVALREIGSRWCGVKYFEVIAVKHNRVKKFSAVHPRFRR